MIEFVISGCVIEGLVLEPKLCCKGVYFIRGDISYWEKLQGIFGDVDFRVVEELKIGFFILLSGKYLN